jgi:hypothetical protein
MLPRRIPATWAVTALATAAAAVGALGSDLRWTVPVGGLIAHGSLPHSIPFASAPSAGWHDAPALGQLVLWALDSVGGDRGLLLAQIAAAGLAWALLALGLRRQGSTEGTAALVALVVFVGCLPVVITARVWLFSLALFPVLLLLLESQSRTPSARIWLVVPLLALWSNLYGGALVGWFVVLLYLAAARRWREPWTPLLLAGASTLALSLTPVLWNTAAYYRQALQNEAARRGLGLWSPLRLHGAGIVIIAAGVVLLVLAARGRPLLWEWVVLVVLAAATIHAWRFAPYLLFTAAYPAGRAVRLGRPPRAVTLVGLALLVALTVDGLAITKQSHGLRPLARQAAATGLPVLADPTVAEQVEQDGGRVWLANPLDAFGRRDQSLWLDWVEAKPGGSAAVDHARLVIVGRKTQNGRAAARDPRLVLVRAEGDYVLYRVR